MTRKSSARSVALAIAFALGLSPSLTGCAQTPRFDARAAPPAPDFTQPAAWLALPGRNGLERSTSPGHDAIDETQASADVFFIPPTTYKGSDVANAAWNASDASAPLNPIVLMEQASVFNACCRIYAPHYRQATLKALSQQQAMDLAYADVAAAFREFIAEHNQGRPFIIASHSQGTAHAIRLLQEEVLGGPLQDRLVVAYLIGGYVPADFGELGLPVCDAPRQTGCVLTWNAGKIGNAASRIIITDKTYWWRGEPRSADPAPALCVNPLTWRAGNAASAPASANLGSLPTPPAPTSAFATTLAPPALALTGARCRDGMLEVDLRDGGPDGFSSPLSALFGSYHLVDYGLFYDALRRNAVDRVQAWTASHMPR